MMPTVELCQLHHSAVEERLASPIELVNKGNCLRFCGDYHMLRVTTKKGVYPLQCIGDELDGLRHVQFVSSMHINSSARQIEAKERVPKMTAFITPDCLHEVQLMSFVIWTSPAAS